MVKGGTITVLPLTSGSKQRGGVVQRFAEMNTWASPGRRADQTIRSRLFPVHSPAPLGIVGCIPGVDERVGVGVGWTVGVRVAVAVGIWVAVRVAVGVRVEVPVRVGVPKAAVGVAVPAPPPLVGVRVGVRVAVAVGVAVGGAPLRIVVGSLAKLLDDALSPVIATWAVFVTVG
jgi:hypothetical protein